MILCGYATKEFDYKGAKCLKTRCYFMRPIKQGGKGHAPVLTAELPLNFDVNNLEIGADYVVESYDYECTNNDTGELFKIKKISNLVIFN